MHRRPRWPSLLLAVLLLATSLPPTQAVAQRSLQPIGAGARFLPADTAFYLAADLDPDSEQFRYLGRLAGLYTDAPQVESARNALGQPLGFYADAEDLWRDISTWIGGEAFLAAPTMADLQALSSIANSGIDLDCRDPGVLFGVSIADLGAFREFLTRTELTLRVAGIQARAERYNGTDVMAIGGSPEGGATYYAVHDGYLLVSGSWATLTGALDRSAAGSLAETAAFHEAIARFPDRPLAFLYTNAEQELLFGSAAAAQQAATRWAAAALRLGPDFVRVDVAAATNASILTAATRALLSKPSNNLRSARIVPADTSLFLGWDNLKLLWDQVKEEVPADEYQEFKQEAIRETGIDPDADVFDWMTGEFTIFVSPSREFGGSFRDLGVGIAIEAKDRAVARQKVDKYLESIRRLAPANRQPSEQEIAGLSFWRIPVAEETVFYGQLVEDWLIVTSSGGVASDVIASLRGAGGVQAQPEYGVVRQNMPQPLQFLGYVNLPELVRITTSALGATAAEQAEFDPYVRPFRSVGLGVATTPDRIDATLYVHVVVPDQPLNFPAPSTPTRQTEESRVDRGPDVLIDASRGGDVWWSSDESPNRRRLPGLGAPLVRYLHDDLGADSVDTVLPGQRIGRRSPGVRDLMGAFSLITQIPTGRGDPDVIQPFEEIVVRVGSDGAYSDAELATYRDYVRCGGTLLLLTDGKDPGMYDELAGTFGLDVRGTIAGSGVLNDYRRHAATTGADAMSLPNGAGLVAWDDATEVVGYLDAGSFLDLNGDGVRGEDEPVAPPALAIRKYGRGTVAFLGTTSVVTKPEQATFRALLRHLASDAPWRGPINPDQYEPDNTPQQANALSVDGGRQEHSIHGPGDVDWVAMDLPAGERVRVGASSREVDCDLQTTVFGPDMVTRLAVSRGFTGTAEFRADEAGRYYARVIQDENPYDTCRTYAVTARVVPPPEADRYEPDDSREQARALPPETASQTHSLHVPGDVDWSSIVLQPEQRLRVVVFGSGTDCRPQLTLYAPDGTVTPGTMRGPFLGLDYTATSAGTYYLEIEQEDPNGICDAYQLEVRVQRPLVADSYEPDNSAALAKPLPPDGTLQEHSLHEEGDNDWVSFPLNAGDRLRLFTLSSTCDTYLYLYAPDGTTVLAEDDDSGEDNDSVINYRATETGTYYGRVRHYEPTGTCDAYRLAATITPGGPPGSVTPTPARPPGGTPVAPTPTSGTPIPGTSPTTSGGSATPTAATAVTVSATATSSVPSGPGPTAGQPSPTPTLAPGSGSATGG